MKEERTQLVTQERYSSQSHKCFTACSISSLPFEGVQRKSQHMVAWLFFFPGLTWVQRVRSDERARSHLGTSLTRSEMGKRWERKEVHICWQVDEWWWCEVSEVVKRG